MSGAAWAEPGTDDDVVVDAGAVVLVVDDVLVVVELVGELEVVVLDGTEVVVDPCGLVPVVDVAVTAAGAVALYAASVPPVRADTG